MRLLLLATAVVLALPASAVLPSSTPGSAGLVTAQGQGSEALDELVEFLGFTPREVTITTYGLGGAHERVVDWDAFKAAFAGTRASADSHELSPVPLPVPPIVCLPVFCPDAGYGTGAGFPFCDDSSAWLIYSGAPSGSSYTELVAKGPAPEVCGGFFGSAMEWEALEMSATKVPDVLSGLIDEGCYASVWVVHPDGLCPSSYPIGGGGVLPTQGAIDTWLLHIRARGPGVAATLGFGGTEFDYFLGDGATLCYDLPPRVQYGGVQCA